MKKLMIRNDQRLSVEGRGKWQNRLFRVFSLLMVAVFGSSALWAQLTNGKVYNFVNVGNNTQSMAISGIDGVAISATNTSDYAQLWYVSKNADNTYSLRNLMSGCYLRSSNKTSGKWTMVNEIDANCKFNCLMAGSGYTLRASNTNDAYHHMHYGASQGAVVCWEPGNEATQWTINAVNVSTADLQANWNKLADLNVTASQLAGYQTALDNLFKDKACTELKKAYASEAALTADANYQALPATLQAMALKVYRNAWEENNYNGSKPAWDAKYAKKYRVQLYEPYNEPEAAAKALGINAHTNLNNPTGIFGGQQQPVYIMVEGTIKEGASLYLASYTGHDKLGGYDNGIELHEGLNLIPSYVDGTNFCVNYVVHTFDTSNDKTGNKAKVRKLSDYPDLKIHIEGGYINGYYNKVGDALYTADKNSDWEYIEARATQTDVTVLGKYITLQFPLLDADTKDSDGNYNSGLSSYFNEKVKIEEVINEWDNIMLWERLLLGVLDETTTNAEAQKSPYSDKERVFEYTGNDTDGFSSGYGDYYNVHGLSFGTPSNYMYGGWDHCGYNFNTMYSVIGELATNAGAHWGPGHEIGHQHQKLLTVNGLTEVTNNLFSNVVLWYYGETTSRYNGTDGTLSNVLAQFNTKGADFFSNNIWAQTIMYYKLFLYYHVLGHNTKFYPRLFEMLRQNPMSEGYDQDGEKCLMHFYKLCCDASGDDLTEFFRAHGFFEVMNKRFVDDYAKSEYTLTQAQIDAAIASVKAKDYPENISVLFINDATGETIKSYKGDNLELYGETTVSAEVGCYASFVEGQKASAYTYALDGTKIAMKGTGGVGFAIFNKKGELVGFSDNKEFTVSAETAQLIASGEALVKVMNADNTQVFAKDELLYSSEAAVRKELGDLLEKVAVLKTLVDDSGKKVGYYSTAVLTDLNRAYTDAKAIYDAQNADAYMSAYKTLNGEYVALMCGDAAINCVVSGAVYELQNKQYTSRYMSINGDKIVTGATTSGTDAQKWYFEASETPGLWYLKNKSTNTYVKAIETSKALDASAESKSDAALYSIVPMGDGSIAVVGSTSIHCAESHGYKVVGWTWQDSPASHWYATAVEINETDMAREQLQKMVDDTKALINTVGSVERVKSKLTLTEDNYKSNAECKNTLYGDEFTSYSVLCDNNSATFFHSDYSDQAPKEHHYIRMDVGENSKLKEFTLWYTTRGGDGNVCAPTRLAIEVSNDAADWTKLTEISSGLPTQNDKTYETAELGNDNEYRYVRVVVYNTSGGQDKNGYQYFVMSELGLYAFNFVVTKNDAYAAVADALMTEAHKAVLAASDVLTSGKTADDYKTAYDALLSKYQALQSAANDALVAGHKSELKAWLDKMSALLENCGEVTAGVQTIENKLTLQTADEKGDGYLYCNAPYLASQNDDYSPASEGYWLLDGKYTTYLHTDYSNNAPDEDHYLRVYVGENGGLDAFKFNYSTRGGNGVYVGNPATLVVEGSNTANGSYAEIATLTKSDAQNPLPTGGGAQKHYVSNNLGNGNYKYIRFRVTANEGNQKSNNHYWFYMSEFGVTKLSEKYVISATVNEDAGCVTENLLIDAYVENSAAQSVHDYSSTPEHVVAAIASIQAQYEALLEAYNKLNKTPLLTLAQQTQALVDDCYETVGGVKTFKYAGSLYLAESDVEVVETAIATALGVYNDETVTEDAYLSALDALQAVYNQFVYAHNHASLPVMVTSDMKKPYVYAIKIKRDRTPALAYDNASKMVSVTDYSEGTEAQLWYFIDNTAKNGKVLMLPYYGKNTSLVLASNDLTQGTEKVKAVAKDAAGYVQEWSIVANANNAGWYNITCLNNSGSTFYFSNHSGTAHKMGFYNVATDPGSLFSFVNATVTQTQTAALAVTGTFNVKVERNFAEGWSTICLPFATTVEALGAAEAQEFTNASDEGLNFAEVTNLKANVPYLVKFDEEVVEPYFAGVTVETATPSAVTYGDWQFDGTYTGIAAPNMEGLYGVTTAIEEDGETYQALRRGSNKASIKGTRAYFRYTGNQNVQQMRLVLNGTTTGIGSIQDGKVTISKFPADIYSLDGRIVRRMANDLEGLSKGVYIINGEKVLVK